MVTFYIERFSIFGTSFLFPPIMNRVKKSIGLNVKYYYSKNQPFLNQMSWIFLWWPNLSQAGSKARLSNNLLFMNKIMLGLVITKLDPELGSAQPQLVCKQFLRWSVHMKNEDIKISINSLIIIRKVVLIADLTRAMC